jgi:GNAT superfamily N-acetyltransferase
MQHPRLNIREVPWSNPVGADLRAAQQRELASRFGTTDHEPGPPPTAEDMPVFLIAYEKSSGQPLGCGGLRRLDESTAEIKRVYVVPYARGSGVSGAILAALEAKALAAGYTEIRAEAGSVQTDGMRFYERGGYRPIPNFGPYEGVAGSHCYAKTIAVRATAPVP